jgi:hypothetical protein
MGIFLDELKDLVRNKKHRMNSKQYEELCRIFLAEKLGMNVEQVQSIHIPNPARPGLPKYKHQIDLYWETESELSKYLHVANAKWRGSDKVDQSDVLLLQKVKEKVAAHKALMITTQGYTAGAVAAAKDEGIALHIVRPNFDFGILPIQDRSAIQAKLLEVASTSNHPVFQHEVIHKAFDFREISPQSHVSSGSFGSPSYQTKVISGYETKLVSGHSNKAGTHSASQSGTVTKSGGPIRTK